MKRLLVLSTASSVQEAKKIAKVLLCQRVAACVTLVPGVQSHYWWKGKIEKAAEVILLIKTKESLFHRVEKLILKHHAYTTPEIIAVPLIRGSRGYLKWLDAETAKGAGKN